MLTLTPAPADALSNSGVKRLPDAFVDIVRRLVANKLTRSAVEAAIPADKSALLDAMGDASAAICGPFTLTQKPAGAVQASFSLKDGRKIKLADIKGFTTQDGKRFSAADIASIFGGRFGYTDLSVTE